MVSFTSFALKTDKRIQDDITAFELGAKRVGDGIYTIEDNKVIERNSFKISSNSLYITEDMFLFNTVYMGSTIEANFAIIGATNLISIDKPDWVNITKINKTYEDDGSLRSIDVCLSINTFNLGNFLGNLTAETNNGNVTLPISVNVRNSPFPRSNLLMCKTPFHKYSGSNKSVMTQLFASNNINVSYTEELPENLDNYDTIIATASLLSDISMDTANRLKNVLDNEKKLILLADDFFGNSVSGANMVLNISGAGLEVLQQDRGSVIIDKENIKPDIITDGVNKLKILRPSPILNKSSAPKVLVKDPTHKYHGFLAVNRKKGSLVMFGDSLIWNSFLYLSGDAASYDNSKLFVNMIAGNCSDGVRNGNEIGIDYGGSCSFERGKSLIKDLLISPENITFSKVGNKINVSALFYRDGVKGPIKVMFIQVYNSEKAESKTVTVNEDIASVLLELERDHKVIILVDPTNEIRESSKSNNRAEREYDALPNIYIDIATIEKIKPEIMDYIKNNVKYSYVTDDKDAADIFVHIGRFNSKVAAENRYTLDNLGWGWKGGIVTRLMENEGKPYGGLVGSFNKDGKKYIFIYGNSIDGEIAAVKSFIFYESNLVNTKYSYLINKYNVNALAVYDYLHTSENKEHYNKNSDEFASIVHKALNGMYTMSDITIAANVAGENVDLRLRHIKPDNSELFLSYKDPSGLPVVMAGGLWSDITAWDELGRELAIEGRDVWLIEITGGAGMDCDSCPNYLYSDLTDFVLPAYINFIKSYTGKSKVQYVGHSNGARVALDALTEGKVNPDDVDTLVLVGVPGAFSELSYFARVVNQSGGLAIQRMDNRELHHITFARTAHEVENFFGEFVAMGYFLFGDKNRISLGLFSQYYDWIRLTDDHQPGIGLNLNYSTLIYGTDGPGRDNSNDYIVPILDSLRIYNNIISQNKVSRDVFTNHMVMTSNREILSRIKESLDKSVYEG